MEEHESRCEFSSIELCPGLLETPRLLDVKHEVATIYKLHDKEQTILANREIAPGTCNELFQNIVDLVTDLIKEEIIVSYKYVA